MIPRVDPARPRAVGLFAAPGGGRASWSLPDALVWLAVVLVCLASAHEARATEDAADWLHWEPLIQQLMSEGYDEAFLREHFSHSEASYLPDAMSSKLLALFKRKYEPPRPSNKKSSGPPLYQSVLTKERIAEAKAFLNANSALLKRVKKTYGVPGEIATALLTVETRLGEYLGTDNAFSTLASMALSRDPVVARGRFPDRELTSEQEAWLLIRAQEKAEWAYAELKALLDYAWLNRMNPVELAGSVYGAIGVSQFMPSNALRFGVDGDSDGRVDLFNLSDAVCSMANYLVEHGWSGKLKKSDQFNVLYRYNHSRIYANTILELANRIKR